MVINTNSFYFGCEANQSDLIKKGSSKSGSFPSTYKIKPHNPFMIVNTNILDGVGNLLTNTDLLIENGKIKEIGVGLPTKNYRLVNGTNLWVTPGLSLMSTRTWEYILRLGPLIIQMEMK